MQPEDNHLSIPPEFESSPWIQQLVSILKEQVQRIQEQTQRIQEQAEEISALKKTVQEQFTIFNHAACWVHMERPLRKLKVTSRKAEKELAQVREAIWTLYDKVKEASRTQSNKEEVQDLYDELISMRSISPEENKVIASFAENREEMLKALDHPGLPLHNNDSERDIRGVAKRRNISGSTKSEEGKAFRNILV